MSEKYSIKDAENRENGRITYLRILSQSSSCSPHRFYLVYSASLSKTRGASVSLSLSVHQRQTPTPATLLPFVVNRLSITSPATQQSSQAKATQNKPVACNVTASFSTTSPATTGHHFRRHHDHKNHLDLLYPKVLTGTLFITLENLQIFCSSSSFSRCMQGTISVPLHAGWA